ncbi:MAG: cytochrome c oxidase subunit II [Isosphaeraceae bacterium]|nr:cytochrome c oxidase subunit II [Isosphaeraceae bacterium]
MEPQNLSIFAPASPPAESIRTLSVLVFVITGLIFVVVEGILIVLIVRSRRRVGDETQEPPQIYGSKPIEIAWTAAPLLIVLVLALVSARSLWEVRVDPPRPHEGSGALFVTVIGHQWWWEYRYETYDGKTLGFIAANELHVPASDGDIVRPVYLTLESADVCHSFWVPRLGGKTDLIPGRVTSMWFQTRERGLFVGQCAEYCGTQHANMLIRVVVDAPADFARWVEAQQQPAQEEPAASEGKAAFLAQSCVNCHRVRGTTANGSYAPDLTHLMSRDTLAAGMVPNTPKELRRWVENPQDVKPGCLMPAFRLDERKKKLILDYLQTLR